MARDLWVPLALTAENRAVRENHNLAAVARLKPGVDVPTRPGRELEVIAKRLGAGVSGGQRRAGARR